MPQAAGFQVPVNSPSPQERETESIVARSATSDATLMEVSVRIARQFPRKEPEIMAKLRATLEAYPQFAEKALYSYPVEDRRRGRTVYIEGLSIRAAETLAAAWGNLRAGVRIVGEDDAGIDLEAVAFDMENNLTELAPGRALKTLKTREGRMVILDERALLQARQSAASKTKRNAILAVLPLHLKAFFEAEVRKHMAGGEETKAASSERVTRALQRFEKEYKVTQAQLEAWVEKPVSMWTGGDIVDLQKLFNGLEQGEVSVAEAFPPEPAAPTGPIQAPPPVVVETKDGNLKASPQPEPDPATTPTGTAPPPPKRERRARATPYVAPPTAATMPEPTPGPVTPAPVTMPGPARVVVDTARESEDEVRLRLSVEIAQAETVEAVDAIVGRVYSDKTIPRGLKQVALDFATERRDQLQEGQ